jgi:threonine/homoserine/homoserine lactone efflux protein
MILEFLLACLLIELTPGPNMAWITLMAVARGRAIALITVAGIALGLALAGLTAAVGLSALIKTTPWLFQALRWGGALYLVYLARDALQTTATSTPGEFTENPSRYFVQGLLSNILNPKAYLFYAAILPQFVDPGKPLPAQFALLTALYVAVATLVHATLAILAGFFNRLLNQPRDLARLGRVFAVLLVAIAFWFFYSTGQKS